MVRRSPTLGMVTGEVETIRARGVSVRRDAEGNLERNTNSVSSPISWSGDELH